MAVSLLTGVLFGIVPALHSTRAELASTLKDRAGQSAGGRTAARLRQGLVTVQFSLSLTLLVAAGLSIQSLGNVSRVELGHLAQSLLYEIEGPQPAVVVAAVVVLSAVAFGAGYLPARRASRVSPMVALRYE